MKANKFQWAWNGHAPQNDPLMTRDRAARLLRAWRRQVRQTANDKNIIECLRVNAHAYRVCSSYGETGLLIIGGDS